MPYNILSSDGGGIRSILTASIYREITKKHVDFMRHVDVFAGTSGGAIVSAGLAIGMSPSDVVEKFKESAKSIFKTTINRKLGNVFGVFGATYDNKNLIKEVKSIFGNMRFRDLNSHLLITAFDLQHKATMNHYKWRPVVFHNLDGNNATPDEFIADVVIRSASAPTYFPSYQGYVDGGVFANNPSMAILSQRLRQKNMVIKLLSVGTGDMYRAITGEDNDWGVGQWISDVRIIDLLMNAPNDATDYYCRSILKDSYLRINPAIGDVPLDAVNRMDELESLGQTCIDENVNKWILDNWGVMD